RIGDGDVAAAVVVEVPDDGRVEGGQRIVADTEAEVVDEGRRKRPGACPREQGGREVARLRDREVVLSVVAQVADGDRPVVVRVEPRRRLECAVAQPSEGP